MKSENQKKETKNRIIGDNDEATAWLKALRTSKSSSAEESKVEEKSIEDYERKGWVTIGGGSCDSGEGQHCGGSPVFIDGSGTITKGPKTIVGLKPSEISKARNKVKPPKIGKVDKQDKPSEPPQQEQPKQKPPQMEDPNKPQPKDWQEEPPPVRKDEQSQQKPSEKPPEVPPEKQAAPKQELGLPTPEEIEQQTGKPQSQKPAPTEEEIKQQYDANEEKFADVSRKHIMQYVQRTLKFSSSLSPSQRAVNAQAMNSVLTKMPPEAINRFMKGMQEIKWHGNFGEVTKDFNKSLIEQGRKDLADKYKGMTIYGFYRPKDKSLALDGPAPSRLKTPGSEKDANLSAEGVYAHEMAHAMDYNSETDKWELSGNPEWKRAFKDEIVGDGKNFKLSNYAATNSAEGFAEFGRLLYGSSKSDLKKAEKMFPKCFAYWRSKGLWK